MAQLNDLLVLGKTNLIGAISAPGGVSLNILNIPTSSGVSTLGPGSNGQVLKTNGTTVYWGTDNNTTYSAAGSALGLVKTGGDVTISSGVITVNDDSHNHIISNIDGLQTALDGKQPSGNYKVTQTAVTSPSASGNTTSFIDSITQNTNGVITATKKTIPTGDGSTKGIGYIYPSADCTTYTSDSGGAVTPAAVKKAVGLFVTVSQALTSGTKVGSITVNGTTTDLYCQTNTNTKNTAGSTNSTSKLYLIGAATQAASPQTYSNSAVYTTNGSLYASAVYGAVWNDYAEFRNQTEEIEPGYCVISSPNGQVSKTTSRLCPCDGIVSDTYGFAIGETEECKTPLATSGRVLVYYSGDISEYAIGDAVCAGADGKVSKMTREEIREWPDRIVGTVSEFPTYETWGSGNVEVNGRIWIKVK